MTVRPFRCTVLRTACTIHSVYSTCVCVNAYKIQDAQGGPCGVCSTVDISEISKWPGGLWTFSSPHFPRVKYRETVFPFFLPPDTPDTVIF